MPGFPFQPEARDVPAELQPEIDASVRRFEDQLGGMFVLAKMNGWLEKYRLEVTEMVMKGYDAGKRDLPPIPRPKL